MARLARLPHVACEAAYLSRVSYEYSLRYATTTSMSAEDVHRMGLEQMAELTARLVVGSGLHHKRWTR